VIQSVSGIEEAMMAVDDLVAHFSEIGDPRCAGSGGQDGCLTLLPF